MANVASLMLGPLTGTGTATRVTCELIIIIIIYLPSVYNARYIGTSKANNYN